jgi:uncharacterized protein
MRGMRRPRSALSLMALSMIGLAIAIAGVARAAPAAPRGPIRVLLLDGQNNHDWRRTTAELLATLREGGRFTVAVSTSPEKEAPPAAWRGWRPPFARHEVVVVNYNGQGWPEPVQRAFVAFIEGGGGAVMVHAANNPFPEWPVWNQMIGLGWRKADYGPRVTIDDATGALVRTPAGQGPGAGHGPSHLFQIKVRQPDHPIMRGLPALWLHGKDQLSHGQRGPAPAQMQVLDSAFSAREKGGTGEHEPMTWVIPHGKGHVVTTLLGHQWRDQADADALRCVGFMTVFARSVEWAARQKVTIPMPANFPGPDAVSLVSR